MPSKPSDVFAVAKHLRESAHGEASLRSAVSRAYYSALLRANEVLPEREDDVQGGDSSHNKVIGRAQVCASAIGQGRAAAAQIAKSLSRMKKARVKADYYLDQTVTEIECDELIVRAEDTLSHCDEFARKRAERE